MNTRQTYMRWAKQGMHHRRTPRRIPRKGYTSRATWFPFIGRKNLKF